MAAVIFFSYCKITCFKSLSFTLLKNNWFSIFVFWSWKLSKLLVRTRAWWLLWSLSRAFSLQSYGSYRIALFWVILSRTRWNFTITACINKVTITSISAYTKAYTFNIFAIKFTCDLIITRGSLVLFFCNRRA